MAPPGGEVVNPRRNVAYARSRDSASRFASRSAIVLFKATAGRRPCEVWRRTTSTATPRLRLPSTLATTATAEPL